MSFDLILFGGTGDLAREIADSQRTVNQNMIRNMGGSAR